MSMKRKWNGFQMQQILLVFKYNHFMSQFELQSAYKSFCMNCKPIVSRMQNLWKLYSYPMDVWMLRKKNKKVDIYLAILCYHFIWLF